MQDEDVTETSLVDCEVVLLVYICKFADLSIFDQKIAPVMCLIVEGKGRIFCSSFQYLVLMARAVETSTETDS